MSRPEGVTWEDTHPKAIAWMQARARAFQRGTQRRGMPMQFGTGDPKKAWPKGKPKR